MKLKTIEILDGLVLRARFTVYKNGAFFMATHWDPEDGPESDRSEDVFETYSAALAHMYEQAMWASNAYPGTRILA